MEKHKFASISLKVTGKEFFFCFSVVVGRKHIQNIYLKVIKHTTNKHSSKCLAEQAHVLLKANPGRSLSQCLHFE